jgi:hypothetical protein
VGGEEASTPQAGCSNTVYLASHACAVNDVAVFAGASSGGRDPLQAVAACEDGTVAGLCGYRSSNSSSFGEAVAGQPPVDRGVLRLHRGGGAGAAAIVAWPGVDQGLAAAGASQLLGEQVQRRPRSSPERSRVSAPPESSGWPRCALRSPLLWLLHAPLPFHLPNPNSTGSLRQQLRGPHASVTRPPGLGAAVRPFSRRQVNLAPDSTRGRVCSYRVGGSDAEPRKGGRAGLVSLWLDRARGTVLDLGLPSPTRQASTIYQAALRGVALSSSALTDCSIAASHRCMCGARSVHGRHSAASRAGVLT